jgi:hypothetical protein
MRLVALLVSVLIAGCGPGIVPGGRYAPPLPTTESSDERIPRDYQAYTALVARIGAKAAIHALTKRYRVIAASKRSPPSRASGAKRRGALGGYSVTTCTTTYLNVSGTYDTTTDPILDQTCWTDSYDDGTGPPDVGGGTATDPCAAVEDPTACYAAADKYPKYKSTQERECEAGGGKFVTVNAGKTSGGGTRTDVGTQCVFSMSGVLEPPVVFHQPGGCSGLDIEVWGVAIIIDAPGKPQQTSNTQAGVRVNADCSTSWVAPS